MDGSWSEVLFYEEMWSEVATAGVPYPVIRLAFDAREVAVGSQLASCEGFWALFSMGARRVAVWLEFLAVIQSRLIYEMRSASFADSEGQLTQDPVLLLWSPLQGGT